MQIVNRRKSKDNKVRRLYLWQREGFRSILVRILCCLRFIFIWNTDLMNWWGIWKWYEKINKFIFFSIVYYYWSINIKDKLWNILFFWIKCHIFFIIYIIFPLHKDDSLFLELAWLFFMNRDNLLLWEFYFYGLKYEQPRSWSHDGRSYQFGLVIFVKIYLNYGE